jgi:hypothetical protein
VLSKLPAAQLLLRLDVALDKVLSHCLETVAALGFGQRLARIGQKLFRRLPRLFDA